MPNVSKKKFIDNYIRNIPQILSHQIVADTETPVSTLLKISKNEKYKILDDLGNPVLETINNSYDPDGLETEELTYYWELHDPDNTLDFLPEDRLDPVEAKLVGGGGSPDSNWRDLREWMFRPPFCH